jgi:hypothetical protein
MLRPRLKRLALQQPWRRRAEAGRLPEQHPLDPGHAVNEAEAEIPRGPQQEIVVGKETV